MNIHENVATQALTSFFYHEALWKKEILFNFLLQPFDLKLADVKDVITQDNLKETLIPLPPLAEQKRIVRALEAILPVIDEYRKKEEELARLILSRKII